MRVDVLLGLQWGDEGKGKIVDFLANKYDVIARFQGGPNAGHTLYYNNKKIVLHHIPSGIFHDKPVNLIGNGVVLNPISFKQELEKVQATGINITNKLYLARKAQLILPTHALLDAAYEFAKGKRKIGSTLRGIAPTYTDKIGRNGLRIGDIMLPNFKQRYEALKAKHLQLLQLYNFTDYDLPSLEAAWFEGIELLKTLNLVDGAYFVNRYLQAGKKVLAEGAQGSMLDIDFGTYPYVTSSNTISAGVCNGLGIAPQHIGEVIGITKAYCTRVGAGPFPTELLGDTGEQIRQEGSEFGATTGRPRRCGWIDIPALKYAIMLSGVTQIVMTKVDILSIFKTITACTHYRVDGVLTEELPYDLTQHEIVPVYQNFEGWHCDLTGLTSFEALPATLNTYIVFVEKLLQVPITILSTGPKRNELVHKQSAAPVAV